MLRYTNIDVSVVAFSGPVKIAGRPPKIGRILQEREVIATGANGFVSFSTKFGGRFSIPSNSLAKFASARRYHLGETLDIDLTIDKGRSSINSPKLRGADRIRVRTPVAVTAVRGTEFRVAYDGDFGRNVTEVVKGSVAIATPAEKTMAKEGFGVASTSSGTFTSERLLPPPELLDAGRVQSAEILDFAIVASDAAKAYRVQIAKDAGFLDIVSEQVSQQPLVTFSGLVDGRYFVRARAISEAGLEGKSEAISFRRKRLGADTSSGQSDGGSGYVFQWLPAGEGTTYFAFQLWRADDGSKLMVDETSLSTTGFELSGFEPGVYVWRVVAIQADAEDGLLKVWGPEHKLTISD